QRLQQPREVRAVSRLGQPRQGVDEVPQDLLAAHPLGAAPPADGPQTVLLLIEPALRDELADTLPAALQPVFLLVQLAVLDELVQPAGAFPPCFCLLAGDRTLRAARAVQLYGGLNRSAFKARVHAGPWGLRVPRRLRLFRGTFVIVTH